MENYYSEMQFSSLEIKPCRDAINRVSRINIMKKIFFIAVLLLAGCEQSDIQMKTVDARALHKQFAKHKGKEAVMVNFWATTCSPCLKEFPMVMDLGEAYADKGLKVYFVTTDWWDYRDKALTFLESKKFKGLTFMKEEGNDNNFIRAISDDWSGALPFTIVYDKNGNVTDTWEMEQDRAFFEAAIIKAISK